MKLVTGLGDGPCRILLEKAHRRQFSGLGQAVAPTRRLVGGPTAKLVKQMHEAACFVRHMTEMGEALVLSKLQGALSESSPLGAQLPKFQLQSDGDSCGGSVTIAASDTTTCMSAGDGGIVSGFNEWYDVQANDGGAQTTVSFPPELDVQIVVIDAVFAPLMPKAFCE